jgi:hypothetical protein
MRSNVISFSVPVNLQIITIFILRKFCGHIPYDRFSYGTLRKRFQKLVRRPHAGQQRRRSTRRSHADRPCRTGSPIAQTRNEDWIGPVMIADESVIAFPMEGGIFGVGRLATRLNQLASADRIGPWHVGQWIDLRHTAIRIRFGTAADGEVAKVACAN